MSEVMESEAHQIYLRLELLGSNYYVFRRNFLELRRLLISAQSEASHDKLWAFGKQDQMFTIINELTRLLYNFLASAKTLVDYTRRIIKESYSGSEFFREYIREKNRRFVNNPAAKFIVDLRHYSQHGQLPFTSADYHYSVDLASNEPQETRTFVLDKSVLLKWSRWTSTSKLYLNQSKDDPVVLEVIDEYYKNVWGFHRWLREQLFELHADELAWLDEMHVKITEVNRSRKAYLRKHFEEE